MKLAYLAASALLALATGAQATKTMYQDNGTTSYVYDNYAEWAADLAGQRIRVEAFEDAALDPAIRSMAGGAVTGGLLYADLFSEERILSFRLSGISALAFDLTELDVKGFPAIAMSVSLGTAASFYTYETVSSGFFGVISDTRITQLDVVDRPSSGPTRMTMDNLYLVDAPAVPESATWALSILGFGMIGAACRGSRRPLTLA